MPVPQSASLSQIAPIPPEPDIQVPRVGPFALLGQLSTASAIPSPSVSTPSPITVTTAEADKVVLSQSVTLTVYSPGSSATNTALAAFVGFGVMVAPVVGDTSHE